MGKPADLSAAHRVGLAGERKRAGTGLADLARCQMKIDDRVVLMHADAALVHTHAPERYGPLSLTEDQRGLDDQAFRDRANLFGNLWRIFLDDLDQRGEALGVLRDELAVEQVLVEQNVE